jgi:hypothetical protein
MKTTKTIVKRYKSRVKRFGPYFPALLLAGVILLLRVTWLVKHSCIPIATQTLSFSEHISYSGVVFSRDNKTFMISDKEFLYHFETKTTNLLNKWPIAAVSYIVRQKDDFDKWVVGFDRRSFTEYKTFSVMAGGIVGDADDIDEDWQFNPVSADKRFAIRYFPTDNRKKEKLEAEKKDHLYKIYDYKTKKHVIVSMHRAPAGFYQPLFWPTAQTVCSRNEDNKLVLHDAQTGKEVAFPAPLQARAKDIIYVNYYKEHHVVIFSDGTVEHYTGNDFKSPVKTFKIAPNAFVDRTFFYLGKTPYLLIRYRLPNGKYTEEKYPRYIDKTDIFSFDSGDKIAYFSNDMTDNRNLQESVGNFSHYNLLVSQNKYKTTHSAGSDKTSFTSENYANYFYHLPQGNKFNFFTRPLLSLQGIGVPTVPNPYEGKFSPNGKFFVSVRSIPKPYNYYNYQQPIKSEVEITTWKLPE